MRLHPLAVVLLVGGVGPLGPAAVAEEVGVFVVARSISPDDAARKEETRQRAVALGQQKKDLEESLRKEFGKKQEKWPADRRADLDRTAAELSRAGFEIAYGVTNAKEVEASAAGIRERLPGKKGLRPVASLAEADLQVEVMGRLVGPDFMGENTCFIGLRISPGGRLDPALVAKASIRWKLHRHMLSGAFATGYHDFTEDVPNWLVEVTHPAGGFGSLWFGKAEGHSAKGLEKFAKENGAALLACRRPQVAPPGP